MLNIGVNINVNVDKIQCPIYFEKINECVHCGGKGTLVFVDKFGRETNKEIYPFDHIKCTKCGKNFSILWNRDEDSGKLIPCAVDRSFKQEFLNLMTHRSIKENGSKEL